MASADSSPFSHTSLYRLLVLIYFPNVLVRSPRVRTITFIPYTCCIYSKGFGQYWILLCHASSSTPHKPYIQFLFIRPELCRRLPSDSSSRRTPLPLANTSYCQVCSGLSPYSYRPCRAHMKLPVASSGVSKYQPHKTNFAASCGELTPKEIRTLKFMFK